MFLHPVGYAGHVVHTSVSRARNVDNLFSCSSGTDNNMRKIALGHVTSNLCFCIWMDLRVT
jgi:hypothetical protein